MIPVHTNEVMIKFEFEFELIAPHTAMQLTGTAHLREGELSMARETPQVTKENLLKQSS